MKKIIVLASLLIVLLTTSSFDSSIIITSEIKGDAVVHSLHPDQNYGKSEFLQSLCWTINGETVVLRSYLNFDLSSIPEGYKIIEAKLSLYSHYSSELPSVGHSHLWGSNVSYIKRVTSFWNENSITWNKQPSTTPKNQVKIPEDTSPFQNYEDIDVTQLLQDMIQNPEKSFGLMISLEGETPYKAMYFASTNCSELTKHPKLVIKINKRYLYKSNNYNLISAK